MSMKNKSRRRFLMSSGAVVASSAMSSILSGCGGGSAMSAAEQTELTASQAIDAIKSGRLSAERYVTTLLDRARKLAALNSMISLNQDAALAAARNIDALVARGAPLPLLAGLPIVVKDNINTLDLPTTGGTPALKDVRPRENAPTLQRLIDAGAIVIGKANMHELAFGTTSTNFSPFAGFVHNPYDRSRVPGGSSGGTGAAIAARISPAGLGTDTGGSVRIPCSLCGIAGLRPSVGNGGADRRYNGKGVLPICHTRDTIGPMARTMADVALLDAVVTGAAVAKPVGLAGLRIGVPGSFWSDSDAQVHAVVSAARSKLQAAGVTFVDVDLPDIWDLDHKVSFQVVLHEALTDIPAYLAETGVTNISLNDIYRQVAGPDVKGPLSEILADSMAPQYDDAVNVYRPRMQALYAAYFRDNNLDGMMFPTTSILAPVIDGLNGSSTVSINGGAPVDTFATMIRNSDPGSTAGMPGISLPAGVSSTGLPVGLSLDGPIGSDARLIGIGLSMEVVLGVVPPPDLAV